MCDVWGGACARARVCVWRARVIFNRGDEEMNGRGKEMKNMRDVHVNVCGNSAVARETPQRHNVTSWL